MTIVIEPEPTVAEAPRTIGVNEQSQPAEILQKLGAAVARIAGAVKERADNGPVGASLTVAVQQAIDVRATGVTGIHHRTARR